MTITYKFMLSVYRLLEDALKGNCETKNTFDMGNA